MTEIDARNVQVSPSGVRLALEAAIASGSVQTGNGGSLAIFLDTCEVIAPLETWLREELLPQLPADSIMVLASRNPPDPGWLARPGWGDLVRIVPLRNFHPDESRRYLKLRDVPLARHESILNFTHGHPLALSLIADTALDAGEFVNPIDDPNVVRALMHQFHRTEPTSPHRRALEISARSRVTTESLLAEAFGGEEGHALFCWLESLSFMDHDGEGLFPHDLVRDVVEADLRWRNPEHYEEVHRLVHRHVVRRIRQTHGREQMQELHSLMFLHRNNPVWQPYIGKDEYGHNYTERATPADTPAILEIIRRHEGDESAAIARYWLQRTPEAFHLVRGLRSRSRASSP